MADGPPDDKSLAGIARLKRAEARRAEARHADAGSPAGLDIRTTLHADSPDDGSPPTRPPDALGEALVARGLISRHRLFNALNESYRDGCPLREALVKLGYISEEELQKQGL